MSGIQQRTKIHFIAALLAHAIADVDFNSHKGVWITSDMLASTLNMHYCIHPSLHFSGNELCTTAMSNNNYLPIVNRGLGLGTINSKNFELNNTSSHVYKCSHHPTKKGSRSTLSFMETVEVRSSTSDSSVGMKRNAICTESEGKSRTQRKSTDKVHVERKIYMLNFYTVRTTQTFSWLLQVENTWCRRKERDKSYYV